MEGERTRIFRRSPNYHAPIVIEHQYSKDELITLRSHPEARKCPKRLDNVYFNTSGRWDPIIWLQSRASRHSTPCEDIAEQVEGPTEPKRKTLDPKDRLKEEEEGIILSPQRRSFSTGCHLTSANANKRSDSPDKEREAHVVPNNPLQRIAPNRIPGRDKENFRKPQTREWDQGKENNRDIHMWDKKPTRVVWRQRSHGSGSCEEEPEWISDGPSSQYETMELIGLAEHEDKKDKNRIKPQNNNNSDIREEVIKRPDSQPKPERRSATPAQEAQQQHDIIEDLINNPPAVSVTYPSERRTSPDGVRVPSPEA